VTTEELLATLLVTVARLEDQNLEILRLLRAKPVKGAKGAAVGPEPPRARLIDGKWHVWGGEGMGWILWTGTGDPGKFYKPKPGAKP